MATPGTREADLRGAGPGFLRPLFFKAILTLLTVVLIEALASAGARTLRGTWVSPRALQRERDALGGAPAAAAETVPSARAWLGALSNPNHVSHPFLGYVLGLSAIPESPYSLQAAALGFPKNRYDLLQPQQLPAFSNLLSLGGHCGELGRPCEAESSHAGPSGPAVSSARRANGGPSRNERTPPQRARDLPFRRV
jgi:hypothetical protein